MGVSQQDIEWLGEEDAHLGSAARTALGILVAADEWTWWRDPSSAAYSLGEAIPRSGNVKWGGDPNVLKARDWLERTRAVAIGQAFLELSGKLKLRVRVLREVWKWVRDAESMGLICADIAQAVGEGRVYPEWPSGRRPSRHSLAVAAVERTVLSPSLALDEVPFDQIVYAKWTPDAKAADLVLVNSVNSLRSVDAAEIVIFYGPEEQYSLESLEVLRSHLRVQCAIHVGIEADAVPAWISDVLLLLSQQGWSLATAIEAVSEQFAVKVSIIAATQTTLVSKSWFSAGFRERIYGQRDDISRYSAGSSSFPVKDTLEAARPSAPTTRVLDASVSQGNASKLGRWPLKGDATISVSIQTKSLLQKLRQPFPDDQVEWEGPSKVLAVHLFEVDRQPASAKLRLPRTGDSSIATFTHVVRSGEVDIRIVVTDGARILQTARLQAAAPGAEIRFFVENRVTDVDKQTSGFAVSLLVNEGLGHQPSMAAITPAGGAVFSLLSGNQIDDARKDLLAVLQKAVSNPSLPLAPLMMELASLGSSLFQTLREYVPNWPGAGSRFQLVTQSDAFFPMEYAYDGVLPETSDAPLCPNSGACLKAGAEIPNCSIRAAQEALCPMGFIGVSGIIERHTWRPGDIVRLWANPADEWPSRLSIRDLSEIAFAASNVADQFTADQVAPHAPVKIADIAAALGVQRIPTWGDWKERLTGNRPPSMLVMLVHMKGSAMCIDGDAGVPIGSLSSKYIGNAPVTVAIGCSTGYAKSPGSDLPAALRRHGARVVIAAMTEVLGRHANRATRDLALRLRDAATSKVSSSVGEIVGALRRELLSDGLALGLSIVAFGDADAVLGGS
ncbi:hypothetical protein ACTJKJ_17035 [Roseateles sp. 22389]|uniref:hypothetical protein n=1 Tax=Roseateles sp. 22389 TaxID=3453916 RepID=UPI003F841A35